VKGGADIDAEFEGKEEIPPKVSTGIKLLAGSEAEIEGLERVVVGDSLAAEELGVG